MSLFWLKEQQPAKPVPGRRPSGARFVLPLDVSKLACGNCTLDKEPLNHPKMQPTGAAKPVFYILGEAPGKQEDEQGKQFIGKSGDVLRDRLMEKWLPHIRWNNSVNCRPPDNRDPTPLELGCCRHRVEADIEATKPAVILAFGAIALQWLTRAQPLPEGHAGGRQAAEAGERGMPTISNWRGRRVPVRVRGHTCWAYAFGHPAWLLRSMNDKRLGKAHLTAFERDLATAFYEYEQGLPEPFVEDPLDYRKGIEVVTQFGHNGLKRILDRLAEIAQRPSIGIDVETNALAPYKRNDPKILSVAVGTYDDTLAFGLDHPDCRWTKDERDLLLSKLYQFLMGSGEKWAHYLKMEQAWFRWLFNDHVLYKTEWGDTHAQAHAIDERPGKELDDLTMLYFGFNVKDVEKVDKKRLSEYPLEKVLWYNGMDTKYTEALSQVQGAIIEEQGLQLAYENLARLSPSLVRMQAKGLVRNIPQIELLHAELEKKEAQAVRKLLENKDVVRFKETHAKFNPNSTHDLHAFFKWAGFKDLPNVDEATLLEVNHPVARGVLAMRGEKKLKSTYVSPLRNGGKHVATDGRVHPNFNQSTTVTTRLASDDPNAQNFPRRERKEIRRVIGVPPGCKFVAMDYGQLEARVVAMLTKDPILVAETWAGDDIHGVWTEKLGAKFVPKMLLADKKKVRDGVKNLWTFPQFFKSQLGSIARDLSNRWEVEVSERALQPYSEEFWNKYQRVLQWHVELIAAYWETGYVETAHGFRRHEPMNENEIVNHPIQGTAAQIVLDAQYRIDLLSYEQGRAHRAPIMNVHDDLSFYLPEESLEEDVEFLAQQMCCCSYSFINVPLAVEVSLGDNWCDKEDLHTFKSTDFQ